MEKDQLKEKLKRLKRERDKLKQENAELRAHFDDEHPVYHDVSLLVEQNEFDVRYAKLNYTEQGFLEILDIMRKSVCENANTDAKQALYDFFDDAEHIRKLVSLIKTR